MPTSRRARAWGALALLAAALAAAAAPPSAVPYFPPAGIDTGARDTSVRPGDDFYRYVNGGWLDRTAIPAGEGSVSLAGDIDQRVEERLHTLLEAAAAQPEPAASTQAKVGAMYASYLDEGRIEALGATPIQPDLDALAQVRTKADLARLMGRSHGDLGRSLFELGVDVDLGDPARYALYLGQAGLGMPGRGYYVANEHRLTRAAYRAYIERLLTLAGWRDPGTTAGAVYAFEARIAEASWSHDAQRDVRHMYNPMSPEELSALAPGFAWTEFLAGAGVTGRSRLVVAEYSAIPKLATIYADVPLDTLKAWMAFVIADSAAPYLSSDFQQAHFKFRRTALLGQRTEDPRWRRALTLVSGGNCAGEPHECFGTLGWAVGELYVARDFPPQAKAGARRMGENLVRAFRARIQALEWMDPSTRAAAVRKLDTYTIKVGYPDHARSYAGVEIRRDDLVGNVRRAARADWEYYVARSGGPVDRADWQMTPQTVDAYTGQMRDLVFPAALMQPPLYDTAADDAVNYGSMGVTIARELTRAVDDTGRAVDADGLARDWWTAADVRNFRARAATLGAQYAAYEPLPGLHVDPELTSAENVADLGGVLIALDAYHASLQGRPAPVIAGLTGDQRFFIAYAQSLRGQVRDDVIRHQVRTDPHAYRKFRAIGPLRNVDAWYDAFRVRPGDRMYLAPGDRVRIW